MCSANGTDIWTIVFHGEMAYQRFFSIKSGCLQGSILGPKFVNLVIDKLIVNLERSHLDCFVGNCFADTFAYFIIKFSKTIAVNVRFMH